MQAGRYAWRVTSNGARETMVSVADVEHQVVGLSDVSVVRISICSLCSK